jgi:hypothetical protein
MSIFEKNIVLVEENLIIGVYEGEITENLLLMNLVICILKWVIWKTRNYIKSGTVVVRIQYHKQINHILSLIFNL